VEKERLRRLSHHPRTTRECADSSHIDTVAAISLTYILMLNCEIQHGRPIDVLIAESTRMGCDLLRETLERYPQCFSSRGCASTTLELLEVARTCPVDIALINIALEPQAYSGLHAVSKLRSLHAAIRVILIVDQPDREAIVNAFRLGVRGVVSRNTSVELLRKAIHIVHSGDVWASQLELGYVLEALAAPKILSIQNARGEALLTKRERELVSLVAQGLTNREISTKLAISEHTVKNYLFHVFDKIGVSSRVELILYAMSRDNAA
jgi:DNA-binding NarL/FixJ family response regulator